MVEKNKGFQVGAHIVMVILSLCCILPVPSAYYVLYYGRAGIDPQRLHAVPEGTQSECLPVHV